MGDYYTRDALLMSAGLRP